MAVIKSYVFVYIPASGVTTKKGRNKRHNYKMKGVGNNTYEKDINILVDHKLNIRCDAVY